MEWFGVLLVKLRMWAAAVSRRPASSRLACAKIARAYAIKLPPWQEAVAEIIRELGAQEGLAKEGLST